ncbi:MAG: hypothetical protein NVV60_09890 [Luteimonas sp.]|nr:hypothetical protein [Luteimonas sp.]
MNWDPFQQEILSTLGHDLHVVSSAAPEATGVERDALVVALLRACARTPDAPDAPALCKEWGTASRLRTASAKRALWPRLRGLRART